MTENDLKVLLILVNVGLLIANFFLILSVRDSKDLDALNDRVENLESIVNKNNDQFIKLANVVNTNVEMNNKNIEYFEGKFDVCGQELEKLSNRLLKLENHKKND